MECAAKCGKKYEAEEMVRCVTCKDKYHYRCLNISSQEYKTLKFDFLRTWRCQRCINVTRRLRNDDTPIGKNHSFTPDDTTMSIDLNDQSALGDTLNTSTDDTYEKNKHEKETSTFTLEQISELLDKKLKQTNHLVISELRNTIKLEINSAVTDLKKEILRISQEQITLKEEITNIHTQIQELRTENEILKNKLQKQQSEYNNTNNNTNNHKNIDDSKTIVLYGLNEYQNESETEIEHRIIHAFMDICQINLTGYIEEFKRIGKQGNRRPIRLELISKRMAKYILSNIRCFRNTGLFVTKFLDSEGLEIRKKQKEQHHTSKTETSAINETRRQSTTNRPVNRQTDNPATHINYSPQMNTVAERRNNISRTTSHSNSFRPSSHRT